MRYPGSVTEVAGFRVGSVTDEAHRTGCTVILCPHGGAVAGGCVMGAAPGTRETDLLRPGNLVERANAVLLTGGSAFGLDAAGGVMTYLEERHEGQDVGVTQVPIVPAAVLFDLSVGDGRVRPDADMGYRACQGASDRPVAQGQVGAGAGATVGKALGDAHAMAGGLGSAALTLPGGAMVAAIVAVNAVGDVLDPATGEIVAGLHDGQGHLLDTQALLLRGAPPQATPGANTTIGCIVTNVALDKAQVNRLAQVGHDGYARAIRPVHTQMDGDTLFALAAGEAQADFTVVCAAAAEVVSRAIVNAVTGGTRL